MNEKIAITFFLDNKSYAYRFWTFVPRVGEEVMLYSAGKEGDEKISFTVLRVVWGVEEDRDPYQAVNIEIERSER